jgi:hypothetical protein
VNQPDPPELVTALTARLTVAEQALDRIATVCAQQAIRDGILLANISLIVTDWQRREHPVERRCPD